jgi:hypothetical protein
MASGFPIIKVLWLVGLDLDQQSSIPSHCEPLTYPPRRRGSNLCQVPLLITLFPV